jgi:hypothetical protein
MSGQKSIIAPVPSDPNAPKHKGALLLKGIPKTTHHAFKSACATKGLPMRDVLLILMRRYTAGVRDDAAKIRIDRMRHGESDEDKV